MRVVLHRAMASYLHALEAHHSPGLPPLPLSECAQALGLDGLAFLLAPDGALPELLQSYGEHTAALEDVQLTQGQGPSLDAARNATMTLTPDVTVLAPSCWPGLPPAVLGLGVHAVFAFPLHIGNISLGVLTGHRIAPGPMTAAQLTDALILADTVAGLLTGAAARPGPPAALLMDDPGLHFAEVHQATGMLAAQLGIPLAQALVRLRAHAFSHDRPLLETARDVLQRRLRLDGTDDGNDTREHP